MATGYPIRAAAKLTGISPETLRAWERRYKAVVPERVGRGRRYRPADIERLGRLNRLVAKGHAIGGIAGLSDEELDALDALPAHSPASSRAASSGDALTPLLSAVGGFDAARAGDELDRLAVLLAPREFVHSVVVPLMREVGTRWYRGEFSVAQEHLVSQLLRNLLGSMIRLFRPPAKAPRMVIAAPAGERHEFGLLAAGMLAALSGIDPVYVGVDLPAEQIGQAAARAEAHMVLLGITVASPHTDGEVRAVATALPAHTQLWMGGGGVAALDLSQLARPVVTFHDLPAFDDACQRRRLTAGTKGRDAHVSYDQRWI